MNIRSERGERRARHWILAIPPPLAPELIPAPPPRVDAYLKHSHLGTYTKAVAIYERPWWRDRGLNGIALATDGPLQMVVDGAAESERGILVGFITGTAAREFDARDADARRRIAIGALTRPFGQQADGPSDYFDFSWATQPWFHGATVAHPEPELLAQYRGLPLEPVGRIHWAGADVARENHAYMDGAIESGERAAAEILARTP